VACWEILSGDSELSSPGCCEPNGPPGGARLTVFGGDPSVDILCQTKIVGNYYRCEMRSRMNGSKVEYIAGSSDLRWNEGLLISHSVVTSCVVFHYTFDLWNIPGPWEKEISIIHIPPFIVICPNSYTTIWDRCSPSYASMTLQVIEGIWYDIPRNPTCTYIQYDG